MSNDATAGGNTAVLPGQTTGSYGPGYQGDERYAVTPDQRWSGGSGGSGGSRAVRTPRRPRGRRRSGGFAALLALGLALAAYGTGLLVHDATGFPGSANALGFILALAVVGVVVTVLGLIGRRGGFSTLVGLFLVFATAVSVATPGVGVADGVGDRTWRPVATDTDVEYRLGIGDGTLDLRNLSTTPSTPVHVDVAQGVGDLTIEVPAGLTAKVSSRVGVGDVSVGNDVVLRRHTGDNDNNGTNTYTWTAGSDATPDVIVDARLGLGSITIEQGQ